MKIRIVYIISGKKYYGECLDADCISIYHLEDIADFMNAFDNWYLEYQDGE